MSVLITNIESVYKKFLYEDVKYVSLQIMPELFRYIVTVLLGCSFVVCIV